MFFNAQALLRDNMKQPLCAEMHAQDNPEIEKERNVAMLDVKNVCAQLSTQFDLE